MTSTPKMNHTMLRIADPKRSLDFYEKYFGMTEVTKLPVPELGFTNYFLAFDKPGSLNANKPWYQREGLLELCHNHDATPETFHANNGNADPHRGFGHICFSLDDLEGTCAQLEADGVKFQKKLSEGRQKNLAFVLDPDGYWIELIANTGVSTRFNHTMLRVKDKDQSLDFYINKLGMKLIAESNHENAKFTLYFLSFDHDDIPRQDREGIVELTWNWGTEKEPDFHYHNGNDKPQGFGHICISVDNVDKAMEKFEQEGVTIQKRRTEGKMKFIGFIKDPDGYSIEVIPREDFPEKILS